MRTHLRRTLLLVLAPALAAALAVSACTIEFIENGDDDPPGDPAADGGSGGWGTDASWLEDAPPLDVVAARCGDGLLDPVIGEQCDDGNNVDGDGCSATCQIESASACGDGVVQPGEQCDNGQPGANTATCDRDCTLAQCGDGLVNFQAGEQCDTAGPSITCDPDCTAVVCGDGLVNPVAGEQCDDGNFVDTDGCRNNCTLP